MPRVLVIDGEEWVAKMLAVAMREQKYHVKTCLTAQAGVAAARGVAFDCIVCDVTLPDQDGYWVARQVRGLRGAAALTPFLFLSKIDHPRARMQGFQMGADVYVTKPFRLGELMPQLAALVQMGARLREVRARFSSRPPAPESPAMAGELSQASIPTLLTVLEMEGRTGTFEVIAGERHLRMQIADGSVVAGDIDGGDTAPLSALRAMLALGDGRFSFTGSTADAARPSESGRHAIGTLLMNALHVEDKAQPVAAPAPVSTPLASLQSEQAEQPVQAGQSAKVEQPRQSLPAEPEDDDLEVEPVEVEPDLSSYRPPG